MRCEFHNSIDVAIFMVSPDLDIMKKFPTCCKMCYYREKTRNLSTYGIFPFYFMQETRELVTWDEAVWQHSTSQNRLVCSPASPPAVHTRYDNKLTVSYPLSLSYLSQEEGRKNRKEKKKKGRQHLTCGANVLSPFCYQFGGCLTGLTTNQLKIPYWLLSCSVRQHNVCVFTLACLVCLVPPSPYQPQHLPKGNLT